MPFDGNTYYRRVKNAQEARASKELGGNEVQRYCVPTRIGKDGTPYRWEPEESLLFSDVTGFVGANARLNSIENFKLFPRMRRNFSYVTYGLNSPKKLSIRLRFDFFNHAQSKNSPPFARCPSDISLGVKSRGKCRLRSEFEARNLPSLAIKPALTSLQNEFKHGSCGLLPPTAQSLRADDLFVLGIMGVQRAGFEGQHILHDGNHKHAINYSGSFDVANTVRPDFFLASLDTGIVEGKRYEMELEITSIISPLNLDNEECAMLIDCSLAEVWHGVETTFDRFTLPKDDPRACMNKTEQAINDPGIVVSDDFEKIYPEEYKNKDLERIFTAPQNRLAHPKKLHIFAETAPEFAKTA